MADIRRDLSELQVIFADNVARDINGQDLRDFLVSAELKKCTLNTADHLADADDQTMLIDSFGGAVTITLPTAIGVLGKRYMVKAIDLTNTCRIVTTASQTIDGSGSYTFATVRDAVTLVSDGSNWQIVSAFIH